MIKHPKLFNRKQTEAMLQGVGLRTTAASLETMASRGGGPKMTKIGRHVYYTEADLAEWITKRCSGPLDSTSTPSNNKVDELFRCESDGGDLEDSDYRNTDDARFDEVTRLEEQGMDIDAMIDAMQDEFDYHAELSRKC